MLECMEFMLTNIQIQPMLRLNKFTISKEHYSNANSNTTNVKVKLTLKQQKDMDLTHSNTTNVKVKLLQYPKNAANQYHSNTTNVKVKLRVVLCHVCIGIIQIQPMLRLNIIIPTIYAHTH